ncbi:hypothetical protein [Spongiactinospora sp. 9N601]|uniref:hypothetical protein n=1 Tax=Spongiactinospora sp. 9N601 TaxID=3375149 RepID=UPI0037B99FEC
MKRKRPISDRTRAVHHPPAAGHPGSPVRLGASKRSRPAAPKVELVPHVVVRDGTITHMEFGHARTPSPFGGPMGDHTSAWASVVDSLHASLHGRPVAESVRTLRERQRDAEAWRPGDDSTGGKLWRTLDPSEQERREGPLEHYSGQVHDLLDQAERALSGPDTADQAPGLLARAIGHHLAYGNLLPYTTVPAQGQTGSKGSGEGAARTAVLKVERHPDAPFSAAGTRENLWKLFSMEAAVREADVERVVAPERTKGVVDDIKKAKELSDRVSGLIQAGDRLKFAGQADSIITAARNLAAHDTGYRDLHDMTAQVIQTVRAVQDLAVDTRPMNPRLLKEYQEALDRRSGALDSLKESLDVTADQALEKSALILAHLLYKHQTTVATAYPNAVGRSDFLTADAAEAAARRLRDHLAADPGNDPAAITRLTKRAEELHAALEPRPQVAADSGWAADSATGDLVVAFSGKELVVQGRAAAPRGVGGHGSHTTAWMCEVDAVRRMLTVSGKERIAARLGTETTKALDGDLMKKLAALLPAEQLEGGQLPAVFDAAASVLAAGSPEESIKAYLGFRNLLPYATVDAGSRDGHGERRGAKAKALFDEESLQAAIDQKRLEFEDSRRGATIAAMREAAHALTTLLPRWTGPVRRAATTTAAALTEPIDTAALADTIMSVRRAEHRRIYNLAEVGPPSTK